MSGHESRVREILLTGIGVRGLMVRAAFLGLSLMCLFGLTNAALDRALDPLYDSNRQYLEKSLAHAGAWMAGIMAVRMGVSAIESVSVEPMGVGMEIGRVVEPVGDALSDMMDLMTFNALLIVFQLAVLEVIRAVSLKYVVGYGALLCAFSYSRMNAIGRMGLGLIAIGLVAYVVYPLALSAASGVFEQHQEHASMNFSESLGVLKERSRDLYSGLPGAATSGSRLKALALEFRAVVSEGTEALWRGLWGLMTSFVIMFILTPLMAVGASYLFVRQIFVALESHSAVAAIDRGLEAIAGAAGRRTKARLDMAGQGGSGVAGDDRPEAMGGDAPRVDSAGGGGADKDGGHA